MITNSYKKKRIEPLLTETCSTEIVSNGDTPYNNATILAFVCCLKKHCGAHMHVNIKLWIDSLKSMKFFSFWNLLENISVDIYLESKTSTSFKQDTNIYSRSPINRTCQKIIHTYADSKEWTQRHLRLIFLL